MTSGENRNVYLDQVVAQQERLEQDLRSKARSPMAPAPAQAAAGGALARPERALPGGGDGRPPPGPGGVDVRVTGFWRWKTVLVPPNAFVVHTGRGRTEPL